MSNDLSVLELCAGGGGQALGLEAAGFTTAAAIEIDPTCRATLSQNRPNWTVLGEDVNHMSGRPYRGVDLLAAGVPCPPFSIAGHQLGADDGRDLFPAALRLVAETRPRAVLLENVRGLATDRFRSYRSSLLAELDRLGYQSEWRVLNASDFGVPQLRPRFVLVALRKRYVRRWQWPQPVGKPPSVGKTLRDLMAARQWSGAHRWAARAAGIGPTIVGGSTKHGGPDLGPTRARAEWRLMGVDGLGIADGPPDAETPAQFLPKLTVRMVARIQGFPDTWSFAGRKTAAYRQVGNAFPPPVANAVGLALRQVLTGTAGRPSQLRLFEPDARWSGEPATLLASARGVPREDR
ncbi:MAG: DNA (cytosine-5-)-methyltransferase [Candidatus Dormiibacterota bacterium]